MKITCTRSISSENKQTALHQNVQIYDHNIFKINHLNTTELRLKLKEITSPIIITSQHALSALVPLLEEINLTPLPEVLCIKGKTSEAAIELGFKLIGTAPNSMLLADEVITQSINKVTHLTSNLSMTPWRDKLASRNIDVAIIEVYHKEMISCKWENYDGLAFFSPSQIDAFLMNNNLLVNAPVFCIGSTTGDYAIKKGIIR